ncbi:MAG: transposase [Nanoarchaeota archaeon]|nr:transposase [Nanoarchaeota archaeon]
MVVRTYKFRLYPNEKQQKKLLQNFRICKEVYNSLLAESRKLWTTRRFDFNLLVKDMKITCPKYYSRAYSQVLQNVSDRLTKSFMNFFRRIKEKKSGKKLKVGFPRFKSRIISITYPQSGFRIIKGNRLYASKIGNLPVKLHRVMKGKIKTMTLKRNNANQWFAYFTCETEKKKTKHCFKKHVGIDVGIESFAVFSNGELIDNPKHLFKSEQKLKKFQRKLSRKKKKSNNRKIARIKVARQHNNIVNQRQDFLHKLSNKITKSYSFIAVENLTITNMVKNHCFAKHINDASWGTFIQMLSYKAVACGGQLVKVNPRGTTTNCSNCGSKQEMPLSTRIYDCPNCGIVLHRDVNSARNILDYSRAGQARTYTPVDRFAYAFPFSRKVSKLEEAGTTRDEPSKATDAGSHAL